MARIPAWVRTAIGAQATLLLGMGLGRFSYTPMVPILIRSDAVTAAEAGYIGAANLAGYLAGGLLMPWLLARANALSILRGCLALSLAALVASAIPAGFLWLAACRGVLGATVAAMMILAVSAVTATAPAGRLGRATAIAFTGVGLGILFSSSLLPLLLDHGLAAAWLGTAAIGAVGLAAGLWGWQGGDPGTTSAQPATGRRGRPSADAIRLVVAQGLFSLGLVPHSIYWVDYLVRGLGWSNADAGLQWMLFGLGAIAGTVAWGSVADRIGFSSALTAVFASLAAGILLPVVVPGPVSVTVSSLVVGAQPGLSAIIAGHAQRAIGPGSMLGLWRWMVLSVGCGQVVGGYGLVTLFDRRGSYLEVFLVGAAAMLAGAVLAFGLRAGDRSPAAIGGS